MVSEADAAWFRDPDLLRADSECVDRLAEMIPPRFFCPTPQDATPTRFLKGAGAKVEAKKAAKERSKKAKRLKLDPSTPMTTVQLQEAEGKGEGEGQEGDDGAAGEGVTKKEKKKKGKKVESAEAGVGRTGTGNIGEDGILLPGPGGAAPGGRASSHEELRQRLQKRLEELRSKRKAEAAEQAKDWRAQRQGKTGAAGRPGAHAHAQAKTQKHRQQRAQEGGTSTGTSTSPSQQQQDAPQGVKQKLPEAATLDFEFGKVRLGGNAGAAAAGAGATGKKRGAKKESTGSLLKKAVALQQQLQAAELGRGEGAVPQQQHLEAAAAKQQHAWSSAVSRAAGQKVLDDPKLLQKSLKRQQKQRQKSAQKWEERHRGAAGAVKEKQQKRDKNIKYRKDKKIATKIAKREKKLMRPGFEGRAGATPINNKPAPGGGATS